jgi:hypothetical protein
LLGGSTVALLPVLRELGDRLQSRWAGHMLAGTWIVALSLPLAALAVGAPADALAGVAGGLGAAFLIAAGLAFVLAPPIKKVVR